MLCFAFVFGYNQCSAQIIYELKDTVAISRKPVIGGKFDLFFRYTFLITGQWTDTIPLLINGTGSTYYGISVNYSLRPRYRFLFQSHINAFKLLFQQTDKKRFPTVGDSVYTMERFRFLYGGVGFYGTRILSLSSDGKRIFSEIGIGGNVNLLLATTKKMKESLPETKRNRIIKEPKIPNAHLWRIEVNAFYRYRWVGLWMTYRLTPLFRPGKEYTSPLQYRYPYPEFPPFEVGFFVIL